MSRRHKPDSGDGHAHALGADSSLFGDDSLFQEGSEGRVPCEEGQMRIDVPKSDPKLGFI